MANTKTTKKAAEVKTEAVKESAATTAAAVKETVKKPAAKKPAAAKKTTAAKKSTAASKAADKAVAAVYIQQNGNEISTDALIDKAKADANIKNAKKIDIYVRPEINMVYYVIDGDTFGNFELC